MAAKGGREQCDRAALIRTLWVSSFGESPVSPGKVRGGVSGEAMGHYVISCGYFILLLASIFEKNLSFLLKTKLSTFFFFNFCVYLFIYSFIFG